MTDYYIHLSLNDIKTTTYKTKTVGPFTCNLQVNACQLQAATLGITGINFLNNAISCED